MSESINTVVLFVAGSSFVVSALFYNLYQRKKEELIKLKEIPVFRPDQQLVQVLQAIPHKRLQYVAVEGLVQADGEPLASQFVPRCFGVIQKLTEEEQWKYWNSLTRTWSPSEVKNISSNLPNCLLKFCFRFLRSSRTRNKKEKKNTVPFSLVSPGAYVTDIYVRVQNPLEACGSYLERVHFKVRRAKEGLVDLVVQGISGEKPVSKVESEELLLVGSTLTGFGEVVMEGGRVMRLQAPKDGRKFVLVSGDHRSFLDRHERCASMWKMLTAVSGITGASLLAGVIYRVLGKEGERSK